MLLRTLFSRELFALGVAALLAHRLRSLLTALGMIFGVAAVICMLSIGEGASAEQLQSIRLMGSENIILRSIEPAASQQAREQNTNVKEYGLRDTDVERLGSLPYVREVVRMREVADTLSNGARKYEGAVLGVTDNLFEVIHLQLARGRTLVDVDEENAQKVCVIGAAVADALFPAADPLGGTVVVQSRSTGAVPYTVVGVLAPVQTAGAPSKGLAARNVNADVYLPLSTVDLRYGDLRVKFGRGTRDIRRIEYSDLILAVESQERVLEVAQMVERVMLHGHKERDYVVTVPLELLQQAEKSKQLWQAVLGSIAGISLLVGGIGIMNIMLASVTERTREIGIRRALGARRAHITAQFLVETLILSIAGGLVGIFVGIGLAALVARFADWRTIVPWWGVVVSFFVSAVIGITFGLYPARAAARLEPIEALRRE